MNLTPATGFPSKHPHPTCSNLFIDRRHLSIEGGTGAADWETGEPIHGRIDNLFTSRDKVRQGAGGTNPTTRSNGYSLVFRVIPLIGLSFDR
jgi:hypothetical protein|uniref:Uncharacterized protein n=1 Tax=Picea glauca TaxID=3330 RepID=A0A101M434_PICGL|nr:hypothetical protein ABT39_MTgene372 [Picea glauca]QHR86495.1 hypothetical protein Q903MT_gene497 [Picea sitchensis]